jgi:hypothetical protein
VLKVMLVLMEHKVLLELKVPKVLLEHKVMLVLMEHKVLLELKVPKEQ